MTRRAERTGAPGNAGGRLLHIEALRILAILMVIFNHTADTGYLRFVGLEGAQQFAGAALSALIKAAVPVFFMIAGALLGGKEESLKDLWGKRILRMLVVLLAVSLFYWILDGKLQLTPEGIRDFLVTVYSSKTSTALWYLYRYLALLVMLPVLRRAARAMKRTEYVYFLVCAVMIVTVIPVAQNILSLGGVKYNKNFALVLMTERTTCYFFLGYFFERVLTERDYTGKMAAGAALLGAADVIAAAALTMYRFSIMPIQSAEAPDHLFDPMSLIPAVSLYVLAKYLFLRWRPRPLTAQVIRFFGSCVFGIYLLERFLREATLPVYSALSGVIGGPAACAVRILAAFFLGAAMTAVLKLIPGVKKFI